MKLLTSVFDSISYLCPRQRPESEALEDVAIFDSDDAEGGKDSPLLPALNVRVN